MKKINNGYVSLKDYNCFGCSPNNGIGLRLHFYSEGDFVISKWTSSPDFEGYHNVLHGGIQATLLDEIANWTIIHLLKRTGVTNSLEVKYLKSVFIHRGEITIKAKIIASDKNTATVFAEILDCEGVVRSNATVCYTTFSENIAVNKFHFPGFESFKLEE